MLITDFHIAFSGRTQSSTRSRGTATKTFRKPSFRSVAEAYADEVKTARQKQNKLGPLTANEQVIFVKNVERRVATYKLNMPAYTKTRWTQCIEALKSAGLTVRPISAEARTDGHKASLKKTAKVSQSARITIKVPRVAPKADTVTLPTDSHETYTDTAKRVLGEFIKAGGTLVGKSLRQLAELVDKARHPGAINPASHASKISTISPVRKALLNMDTPAPTPPAQQELSTDNGGNAQHVSKSIEPVPPKTEPVNKPVQAGTNGQHLPASNGHPLSVMSVMPAKPVIVRYNNGHTVLDARLNGRVPDANGDMRHLAIQLKDTLIKDRSLPTTDALVLSDYHGEQETVEVIAQRYNTSASAVQEILKVRSKHPALIQFRAERDRLSQPTSSVISKTPHTPRPDIQLLFANYMRENGLSDLTDEQMLGLVTGKLKVNNRAQQGYSPALQTMLTALSEYYQAVTRKRDALPVYQREVDRLTTNFLNSKTESDKAITQGILTQLRGSTQPIDTLTYLLLPALYMSEDNDDGTVPTKATKVKPVKRSTETKMEQILRTNVFFRIHNPSPAVIQEAVDICRGIIEERLSPHRSELKLDLPSIIDIAKKNLAGLKSELAKPKKTAKKAETDEKAEKTDPTATRTNLINRLGEIEAGEPVSKHVRPAHQFVQEVIPVLLANKGTAGVRLTIDSKQYTLPALEMLINNPDNASKLNMMTVAQALFNQIEEEVSLARKAE